MSNSNSPELLTTHQYLIGAKDEFGQPARRSVVHSVLTRVLDPTQGITLPHLLDVAYTLPVKNIDPGNGEIEYAGPGMLQVKLLTDDLPRRGLGGTAVAAGKPGWHGETEKRLMAETCITFDEANRLSGKGDVWFDGRELGVESGALADTSSQNYLLQYLADISETGPLTAQSAAEMVTITSLNTGQSALRERTEVDVSGIAKQIADTTGTQMPRSLQAAPHMSCEIAEQLAAHVWMPRTVTTKLEIDNFDASRSSRVITLWELTQYNGHAPVGGPKSHLALYDVMTASSVTPNAYFGIDVSQTVLPLHGTENPPVTTADSAATAREMVNPFIYGVASLKRFRTATSQH